jgi:A/G-specific adenine glycosylase
VLRLWAGLGYYARARNLHRCACRIVDDFGGEFPRDIEAVSSLPGIGRSTAAAILAFAFNQRHAILDGNVKRVLSRYRAVDGWPGERKIEQKLWQLAEAFTPSRQVPAYTQAIMDLGATVCTRGRPRCDACPLAGDCAAHGLGKESAIPSPRPHRPLPVRRTCMLLVEDEAQRIYLQRRPPSGIWGGLWGLPEIAAGDEAAQWCKSRLGAKIKRRHAWDVLRHSFTHFHLDITPMHVFIDSAASVVREEDALWHSPARRLPVGVASPVGALLAKLREISGEP